MPPLTWQEFVRKKTTGKRGRPDFTKLAEQYRKQKKTGRRAAPQPQAKAKPKPAPRARAKTYPKPAPKSRPMPVPKPKARPKAAPKPNPKAGAKAKPKSQMIKLVKSKSGKYWTIPPEYHPMRNCRMTSAKAWIKTGPRGGRYVEDQNGKRCPLRSVPVVEIPPQPHGRVPLGLGAPPPPNANPGANPNPPPPNPNPPPPNPNPPPRPPPRRNNPNPPEAGPDVEEPERMPNYQQPQDLRNDEPLRNMRGFYYTDPWNTNLYPQEFLINRVNLYDVIVAEIVNDRDPLLVSEMNPTTVVETVDHIVMTYPPSAVIAQSYEINAQNPLFPGRLNMFYLRGKLYEFKNWNALVHQLGFRDGARVD